MFAYDENVISVPPFLDESVALNIKVSVHVEVRYITVVYRSTLYEPYFTMI